MSISTTQRWFFATNPLKIINIVVSGESLEIDGRRIPFAENDWLAGGVFVLKGTELAVEAMGGWSDDEQLVVALRDVANDEKLTLSFTVSDGTVDFVVDRDTDAGAQRVARLIGGVRE